MDGRAKRAVRLDGVARRAGSEPERLEDADRLVRQTPEDERQHPGRRAVEPLHVIDRDDDRPACREAAQDVSRGKGDGPGIGRAAGVLAPQRRAVERSAQGTREVVECCLRTVCQEIAKGRVRHPGFRLRGPRHEHGQVPLARLGDTGQPQRGLADPGASLKDQSARAGRQAREEVGDRVELLLATDDRRGAGHDPRASHAGMMQSGRNPSCVRSALARGP
jgi:hypothetical protein